MAEKVSSAQTDRRSTTLARVLPAASRRLVSDERLLALVRRGDSTAFEMLYDRHAAALLSFCFFILGSREDAEDAVQSTFAAAYRALLRDERQIDARPWLYAIARNACFGTLRKRRPQDSEQLARIAGEDMFAKVEQRDSVRRLLAAMLELPERHRTALILAELHGHSQREIGRLLDVSPSTVKSYIFQARATLASERVAREVDCREIRAELTGARGAALLRGRLRRHLRSCEGCSEYASQIARRRRELGALLPLLPSLALRRRVLDATAGKAGGAGALGSVSASAGAGGATLTGGIELGGIGVKALLVKALVLATGLGASAGAGTLVLGVASSQPALHSARVLPGAAAAAWRGPGTLLAGAGTAAAAPTGLSASQTPSAVVSQPTGAGQLVAIEPPSAKHATYDGPGGSPGRGGGSHGATGPGAEHGNANGKGAEHANSAEHGKGAEHGNDAEAHVATKGSSAEHAHSPHGKPAERGKPAARGGGHGAARPAVAPAAPEGSAAKGSSRPPAGPQGADGTGANGSGAGHAGLPSEAATEATNGPAQVPSSPAPGVGAHSPPVEAGHGQPADHGSAKG